MAERSAAPEARRRSPRASLSILCVVGARPNFMKMAPLLRAIERRASMRSILVHTGQHYDHSMSDVFFEELGMRAPDHHLGAGGGTHAEQTAAVMLRLERICRDERPDLAIVVGDVNSTLAAALVAAKMHIDVAHVEAGLRSRDRSMPEEINRLATDAISDLLFATEPAAVENLAAEGHSPDRVHFVGNVMIDNLLYQVRRLDLPGRVPTEHEDIKRALGEYGVVTLHRPSLTDNADRLREVFAALAGIARQLPLVFPVHPRTRQAMARAGVSMPAGIHPLPPLAFNTFLNLWRDARVVLTDSGGLQEETSALNVPCITLRDTTERPVTVTHGTNVVAGTSAARILAAFHALAAAGPPSRRDLMFWDGQAAERVCRVLESEYGLAALTAQREIL